MRRLTSGQSVGRSRRIDQGAASRDGARDLDLPADAKAVVVALLGVVGSFALAWPLVTRTPLRRIL